MTIKLIRDRSSTERTSVLDLRGIVICEGAVGIDISDGSPWRGNK